MNHNTRFPNDGGALEPLPRNFVGARAGPVSHLLTILKVENSESSAARTRASPLAWAPRTFHPPLFSLSEFGIDVNVELDREKVLEEPFFLV